MQLFFLWLSSCAQASSSFVMIQVDGNADDPESKCGAVNYAYAIGKYEVSNSEYAAFLNAVARYADPFRLYSPLMTDHFWGGLVREVSEHGYTYRPKSGYANKPVTFVSWWDAVRYINWLHYGMPNTGRAEQGTTEGNSSVGAYDTSQASKATVLPVRNHDAAYFLPNCSEWIKAGFYDSKQRRYLNYAYPVTYPSAGPPGPMAIRSNFNQRKWAAEFPHLTDTGAYQQARSPAGTYDQAGNVMEWIEDSFGLSKMALGGSLFMGSQATERTYKDSEAPAEKLSSFGFRVAAIPRFQDIRLPVFSGSDFRVSDLKPVISASSTVHGSKYVKVGYANNLFDLRSGKGCVAYEYEMQESEITNQEWSDFLNSVARTSDPYGLFHIDMQRGIGGGIDRIFQSGRWIYRPKQGWYGRPVNYLSWFALARYANWMHYGKPKAESGPGVTEGNAHLGAYDTSRFGEFDGVAVVRDGLFRRNPGAKYFIPNDNEWFKAAYFDPELTGFLQYHRYPNRSNTPPSNQKEMLGSANYQIDTLGEGAPFYLADGDAFGRHGAFGFRHLGGNLWEWVEDWASVGGKACWRCSLPVKGLRGGSFNYVKLGLDARNLDPGDPREGYFVYGGRLARKTDGSNEEGFPACRYSQFQPMLVRAYSYLTDKRLWIAAGVLLSVLIAWYRYRVRRKNVRKISAI